MDYLQEIQQIRAKLQPVEIPITKRLFDVFFSCFLLLLFTPFIFLTILAQKLEGLIIKSNRGPVLYSEIRISQGKPFRLYKFRIFKTSSSKKYLEQNGFVQTKALEQDAKNLIWTGKILKQIYMDELPQLFNILTGDMTLVGPRPSNEVVTWQDAQVGYFQRYLFKCGLTGPFQAAKDLQNTKTQNEIDMEYIEFCKTAPGVKIILNDLAILFQTVLTVIRARGI